MNSISVENFVGCLHPPFGSRAARKVFEDHLAVAGDIKRVQVTLHRDLPAAAAMQREWQISPHETGVVSD